MPKRNKSASLSSSLKKIPSREPQAMLASRAIKLGLIAAAAAVVALSTFYFFSSSSKKETATSSPARRAFPALINEKKAEPVFEDFVGAEACAECHREQYELWKNWFYVASCG